MSVKPFHFLLAPDSFKDSLSAPEICDAMSEGIRQVLPDAKITALPLSDGGEGFLDCMLLTGHGERISLDTVGPLSEPVQADYGLIGTDRKIAVIEMACTSGLHLVPSDSRNPLKTTTFGTGDVIRHVLNQPVERLIIGIGGSATHDVGCGMAQALGVRFFNHNEEITQPICGALLGFIEKIDLSGLDPRLRQLEITVACDVQNPLLGPRGAAQTYARQKGANDAAITQLASGTQHIIGLIEDAAGKMVRDIPGAGAAGGLGAGLLAFLNAQLVSGIDLMMNLAGMDELLPNVDYVFTGEGQTDVQTLHGKTIRGVVQRAKKQNVPVIIISGQIKEEASSLLEEGVQAMYSLCNETVSLQTALKNTKSCMIQKVEQLMRTITVS